MSSFSADGQDDSLDLTSGALQRPAATPPPVKRAASAFGFTGASPVARANDTPQTISLERQEAVFKRSNAQRSEEADVARRTESSAREADFRTRGVKHYTDAFGNLQPVKDAQGREVFTEAKLDPARDEKTGAWYEQRRTSTGEIQRTPAPLRPSADENDPNLYYDLGNDRREKAGHADDILARVDERTVAANPALGEWRKTALKAKEDREKAVRKAALAPLEESARAVEEKAAGAQLRASDLATQAEEMSRQLSEIDANPAIKARAGGVLGIGASATPEAERLQRQRADRQAKLDAIQSERTTIENDLKDGPTAKAKFRAKTELELARAQSEGVDIDTAIEKRRAFLKSAGKPEEGDTYLRTLTAEAEKRGVFASEGRRALREAEKRDREIEANAAALAKDAAKGAQVKTNVHGRDIVANPVTEEERTTLAQEFDSLRAEADKLDTSKPDAVAAFNARVEGANKLRDQLNASAAFGNALAEKAKATASRADLVDRNARRLVKLMEADQEAIEANKKAIRSSTSGMGAASAVASLKPASAQADEFLARFTKEADREAVRAAATAIRDDRTAAKVDWANGLGYRTDHAGRFQINPDSLAPDFQRATKEREPGQAAAPSAREAIEGAVAEKLLTREEADAYLANVTANQRQIEAHAINRTVTNRDFMAWYEKTKAPSLAQEIVARDKDGKLVRETDDGYLAPTDPDNVDGELGFVPTGKIKLNRAQSIQEAALAWLADPKNGSGINDFVQRGYDSMVSMLPIYPVLAVAGRVTGAERLENWANDTLAFIEGRGDVRRDDDFASPLASGVGSVVGFVTTGGVTSAAARGAAARSVVGLRAAGAPRFAAQLAAQLKHAPIFVTTGSQSAAATMRQLDEAGVAREDQWLPMLVSGGFTALTETAPMFRTIETYLDALDGKVKGEFGKRLTTYLATAAKEGVLQELPQQIADNAVSLGYNPQVSGEDWVGKLFEGAGTAVAVGGIVGAGGTAVPTEVRNAVTGLVNAYRQNQVSSANRERIASVRAAREGMAPSVQAITSGDFEGIARRWNYNHAAEHGDLEITPAQAKAASELVTGTDEAMRAARAGVRDGADTGTPEALFAETAAADAEAEHLATYAAALNIQPELDAIPEDAPMIDQATGQPMPQTQVERTRTRDASTALSRIALGVELDALTAQQATALAGLSAELGVPAITPINGVPVVTDAARQWLGERSPTAASLLRPESEMRANQSQGGMMEGQAAQTAPAPATPAPTKPSSADVTAPKAPLNRGQDTAQPSGAGSSQNATTSATVSFTDAQGNRRTRPIPDGATTADGKPVRNVTTARQWIAENAKGRVSDVEFTPATQPVGTVGTAGAQAAQTESAPAAPAPTPSPSEQSRSKNQPTPQNESQNQEEAGQKGLLNQPAPEQVNTPPAPSGQTEAQGVSSSQPPASGSDQPQAPTNAPTPEPAQGAGNTPAASPTAEAIAATLREVDPTDDKGNARNWPSAPDSWVGKVAAAIDTKDADTLRGYVAHGRGFNDSTKKAVFRQIGVPLPKTVAGIEAAIDQWAGITPAERAKRDRDKGIARDLKDAKRTIEEAKRQLSNVNVDVGGGVAKPGVQWVDEMFAAGYDEVVPTGRRGAAKTYGIANRIVGKVWALPNADLLAYARAKEQLAQAERAKAGTEAGGVPVAPPVASAPIIARGKNTPAKFVTEVFRAAELAGNTKARPAVIELAQRLSKANPEGFANMEVRAYSEEEWTGDPSTAAYTPDSSLAYNPDTNTLYLRRARIKGDLKTLVSGIVHESGHFAERFAADSQIVAAAWAALSDTEIVAAAKDYNAEDNRPAAEIRADTRSRSEWFAQQFSRVVTGRAASVPESIRAKLAVFFRAMKAWSVKYLGTDAAASAALDAEILRVMQFDAEAKPVAPEVVTPDVTAQEPVRPDPAPLAALKNYVTGAIQRGEAQPIVEQLAPPAPTVTTRPAGEGATTTTITPERPPRNLTITPGTNPGEYQVRDSGARDTLLAFFKLMPDGAPDRIRYAYPDQRKDDIVSAVSTFRPQSPSAPKPAPSKVDALADKLFDGLLGTPAERIEQRGFPRDRRQIAIDLAEAMIEAGIRTPEGMAGYLDGKFQRKARPFSQSLWSMFAFAEPSLASVPDWDAVYAGIDSPTAPESEAAPDESRAMRELILSDQDRSAKARAMKQMADRRGIPLKQMQEEVEATLVRMMNEQAAGRSPKELFDFAREIYEKQPLFSARTSTSVENQAYSTPAPLAAALANMTNSRNRDMYEPTAGTGMLMMGANGTSSHANELNDVRATALRALGIGEVTQNDATTYVPPKKFARVHANPPFGTIANVNYDGFGIRKLEHIIALRALEAMEDNGNAALILGASLQPGETSRGAQWVFENYLYSRYNVVDNFEVAGDLYANQGTKWPTRIIAIAGRRSTPLTGDLAPKSVDRLQTWDDVWARSEAIRNETTRINQSMGTAGPARPAADSEPGRGSAEDAGGVPAGGIANARPPRVRGQRGGNRVGEQSPARPATGGVQADAPVGNVERPADTAPALPEPGTAGQQLGGVESQPARGATPASDVQTGSGRPDGASVSRKLPEPADVGDRQFTYVPRSEGTPFGTLTPRSIGTGTHAALDALVARVGPIDRFVGDRLNMPAAELRTVMSADQIDGVALAIDQIENGGALVVGDETGIGKGRQAAALIRYAKMQGKIPVFFTLDPKLFTDMNGDLKDINTTINPLIFGEPGKASIVSPTGEVLVRAPDAKGQKAAMKRVLEDGMDEAGYDAIFVTYSQINTRNERQAFLERLAADSSGMIVILDEAHSAAGDGDASMQAAFMQGGEIKRGKGSERVTVSVPGLLRSPATQRGRGGVLYLSATYAKRPDNMPLYFRTDMAKATQNFRDLVEAMKAGGVALQQAVSEALAASGQYLRRERDFSGINFNSKTVQVGDRAKLVGQMDSVTSALQDIVQFSKAARAAVLAEGSDGARSTAMTEEQISVTDFASVVHNQISQLLLSAKADEVVNEALAAKSRGEKPVITLMNTMESFLSDYVADIGAKPGQEFDLSWKELLRNALARTLRVTTKQPNGDTEISTVSPDSLGLRLAYDRVVEAINEIDAAFPVSPIDYIVQRLGDSGMKIGELTGRESGIQYLPGSSTRGTYKRFKKANKNALVNGFNSGDLDALLLNASGSTGLSIHAAPKFKDTRKRHMIIAQPALDINVVVQTLGRIKRTGMLPGSAEYTHLKLPLQAELRPAAVLNRKMKSLNANTTAESEGGVSIQAVDMLNKYGDRIVAEYVAGDLELQDRVNMYPQENEDGVVKGKEDDAKKFMGRLALLPEAEQARIYGEVIPAYNSLIEQLRSTGEYDLDMVIFTDWDGVLTSDMQLTQGTDETSLFTASVRAQQWEITDNRPVPTGEQMTREFQKNHASKAAFETQWRDFSAAVDQRLSAQVKAAESALAEATDAANVEGTTAAQVTLNKARIDTERWERTKASLSRAFVSIGEPVQLTQRAESGADESVDGMLVGVALPSLSGRMLRLAPSRFQLRYMLHQPGGTRFNVSGAQIVSGEFTQVRSYKSLADFTGKSQGSRYDRYVVTGNPIAAYRATGGRGKMVRFKARDGQVITGLLMRQNWSPKDLAEDPRTQLSTGAAVQRFILSQPAYGNFIGVEGDGGVVRIGKSYRGGFEISVPSSVKGRDYFLDPTLREIVGGDFFKSGNRMVGSLSRSNDSIARAAERVARIAGVNMKAIGSGKNVIDMVVKANTQLAPLGTPPESSGLLTDTVADTIALHEFVDVRDADLTRAERNILGKVYENTGVSDTGGAKSFGIVRVFDSRRGDSRLEGGEDAQTKGSIGDAAKAARRYLAAFNIAFGKNVVFFKSLEGYPIRFDGFVPGNDANAIGVDADAPAPLAWVSGHELTHSLRKQRPDLYARLAEAVKGLAGTERLAAHRAWIDKSPSYVNKPQDVKDEEMVADFVGTEFRKPEFWRELSTRMGDGFAELAEAALAFLDKVLGRASKFPRDLSGAFEDVRAARTVLADVLAEYSRGRDFPQQARATASPDDALAASKTTGEATFNELMQQLPDRARDIVRSRLGGESFEGIGSRYGFAARRAESLFRSALGLTRARLRAALKARGQGTQTLGTPSEPTKSDAAAIREHLDSLRDESGLDAAKLEADYQKAIAEQVGERTVGDPRLANPGATDATRAVVSAVDEQRRSEMERESHDLWQAEAERQIAANFPAVVRDLLERVRGGLDIAANPVSVKAAQLAVERLSREAVTSGDPQKLRDAQTLAYAYRVQGSEQARALAARRDPFRTPQQRMAEFFAGILFTPPAPDRKAIEKAWTPREKTRRIEELTQQADGLRRLLAQRERVLAEKEAQAQQPAAPAPATPSVSPTPSPAPSAESDATARRLRARISEVEKELDGVRKRLDREEKLHDINAKRLQKINRVLSKMGVTVADLFAGDAVMRLKGERIVANVAAERDWDATKKRLAKLAAQGWDKASILKKLRLTEDDARRVYEDLRRDVAARLASLGNAALDASNLESVVGPNDPGTLGTPAEPGMGDETDPEKAKKIEDMLAAMGLPAWGELDSPVRKARVQQAERKRAEVRKERTKRPREPRPAPEPSVPGETVTPAPDKGAWADDPDALPPAIDPTDPADATRVIRQAQTADSTGWDMAHEYWINSILSGPLTQGANITGNTLNVAWTLGLKRGLEATVNDLFLRRTDLPHLAEYGHMLRAVVPAISRAWGNAVFAFSTEQSYFSRDILETPLAIANDGFDDRDNRAPSISGTKGRVIRVPVRLLGAVDDFTKTMTASMEAAAHAYRIAKTEGMAGEAMEKRMAGLINTPGSAAWIAAHESAQRMAFQEEHGGDTVVGKIELGARVARRVPGVRYLVPSVRTPLNIFAQGIRQSPFGSLALLARYAGAIREKQRSGTAIAETFPMDEQLGRAIEQFIAFSIAAMLYGAAAGDDDDEDKGLLITGALPEETPGLRALASRAAITPYTLRVGDYQLRYNRIEPLATILGATVDMLTAAKRARNEDRNPALGALAAITTSITAQAENKTMLSGVESLMEAVKQTRQQQDIGAGAKDWAASFLAGWIPNLLRQPVRMADPVVRQRNATSFPEQVAESVIPQLNTPAVDVLGREIERGGNVVARLTIPAEMRGRPELERVDRLLINWNQSREDPAERWAPSPIPARIKIEGNWRAMTDEERNRYATRSGQLAANMLRAAALNVERPSDADIERIKRAFTNARQIARREVFGGTSREE